MLARLLALVAAFSFVLLFKNAEVSAARDALALGGERLLGPMAGFDAAKTRQLRPGSAGRDAQLPAVTPGHSDGTRWRQAMQPTQPAFVAATDTPPLPQSLRQVLPQATGGMLIGVGHIEAGVDPGIVEVRKQIGKFKRLRLEVRDHDIYVHGFRVIYEDGTTAAHEVNLYIPEGRTSDWAAVDGSRFIDRIEISHLAKPELDGHVRIEVMGEAADGWLSDDGEGAKFNDGWVLLGAQPAGFLGFDTDIIPVGEHISGFKEIRVMVHERAVTLNQLRVIYEDGEEDIIPVRERIDPGSTFGPLELRNAPRRIREIQARYRSRFIDKLARSKGTAIVEVWARR